MIWKRASLNTMTAILLSIEHNNEKPRYTRAGSLASELKQIKKWPPRQGDPWWWPLATIGVKDPSRRLEQTLSAQ